MYSIIFTAFSKAKSRHCLDFLDGYACQLTRDLVIFVFGPHEIALLFEDKNRYLFFDLFELFDLFVQNLIIAFLPDVFHVKIVDIVVMLVILKVQLFLRLNRDGFVYCSQFFSLLLFHWLHSFNNIFITVLLAKVWFQDLLACSLDLLSTESYSFVIFNVMHFVHFVEAFDPQLIVHAKGKVLHCEILY